MDLCTVYLFVQPAGNPPLWGEHDAATRRLIKEHWKACGVANWAKLTEEQYDALAVIMEKSSSTQPDATMAAGSKFVASKKEEKETVVLDSDGEQQLEQELEEAEEPAVSAAP
jgi:hypothetical protein